jgi:L-rhamnose mutarotase
MKNAVFLTLCLSLVLTGCVTHQPAPAVAPPTARPPQRFAWVTGLKPEKAEYYRQLHAHPWPGVNRMIKECNIQNFSIHLREIGGKLYLFAYLEYTGADFEADMKKMAADPETRRWWAETDPCQTPLPDAAAKGKIWGDTVEVYYLP